MIGQRNLAPEKGPSVWGRSELAGGPPRNRWVDGLGGVAMAAAGAALVAAGGSRVIRALSARPAWRRDEGYDRDSDQVARESSESFPASDSPSWTPVHGVTPRNRVR